MQNKKLLYIILAILAAGVIISYKMGKIGGDSASVLDSIYPPTDAPTEPIYPPAPTEPIYPPADPIYPPN